MEGESDERVFRQLIRRIDSPDATVYSLQCGGVGRLMRTFPALLKGFNFAHEGGPVTAAFVIRDSDRKDVGRVFQEMREKLVNRNYRFRTELCVIRRNTDTWLLADHGAVNVVAASRSGVAVPEVQGELEGIFDAKQEMRSLLSRARLLYTPAVLEEIASNINLDILSYRVRSFAAFRESVLRAQGEIPLHPQ